MVMKNFCNYSRFEKQTLQATRHIFSTAIIFLSIENKCLYVDPFQSLVTIDNDASSLLSSHEV